MTECHRHLLRPRVHELVRRPLGRVGSLSWRDPGRRVGPLLPPLLGGLALGLALLALLGDVPAGLVDVVLEELAGVFQPRGKIVSELRELATPVIAHHGLLGAGRTDQLCVMSSGTTHWANSSSVT